MRDKEVLLAVGVLAFMSTICMAMTFIWTSGDEQLPNCWNKSVIWYTIVPDGWPDDLNDDAIIHYTEDPEEWCVDLVTVTIDDLSIDGNVTFGAVSGTPTLTVDSLIIGNADHDVTVQIGEDATIVGDGS